MNFTSYALIALLLAVSLFVVPSTSSSQTLLGPSHYYCFNDSPFFGIDFSAGYFYLEDFEDGLLNVPGVTSNGGRRSSSFSASIVDGVDCDTGIIDGDSCGGDAFWNPGSPGFILDFDASVLGALPTHVGVVWVDGAGIITFKAFDQDLVEIGTLTGNHANSNFACINSTEEDRFYGVIFGNGVTTGVRRIQISNSSGGIEIDHLQYGHLIRQCAPHSGDVNADGCVDDNDLLLILFSFGDTGEELGRLDANCDGSVDDNDLLIVLFNFGIGC